MTGPDNKYAYSPIELEAIMHLAPDMQECKRLRYNRYEYFSHIEDSASSTLLMKAIMSEIIDNPPTIEPPAFITHPETAKAISKMFGMDINAYNNYINGRE